MLNVSCTPVVDRCPVSDGATGHEDRFPVARSRSLIVAAGGSSYGGVLAATRQHTRLSGAVVRL